jgi:hypothetical protein
MICILLSPFLSGRELSSFLRTKQKVKQLITSFSLEKPGKNRLERNAKSPVQAETWQGKLLVRL